MIDGKQTLHPRTSSASLFGHAWRDQALCADHPNPALRFADNARGMKAAMVICRSCPVRTECLDWAVSTGQNEGVWGAMTPKQRLGLRRRRA